MSGNIHLLPSLLSSSVHMTLHPCSYGQNEINQRELCVSVLRSCTFLRCLFYNWSMTTLWPWYLLYILIYLFIAQVHPIVPTLCHLWTWRGSQFLSWELGHQGATEWRLYSCWNMNRVCMRASECCKKKKRKKKSFFSFQPIVWWHWF